MTNVFTTAKLCEHGVSVIAYCQKCTGYTVPAGGAVTNARENIKSKILSDPDIDSEAGLGPVTNALPPEPVEIAQFRKLFDNPPIIAYADALRTAAEKLQRDYTEVSNCLTATLKLVKSMQRENAELQAALDAIQRPWNRI